MRVDETGQAFLAYVEAWTAVAERVMAEKGWTPDEALRQSLEVVDGQQGRVSAAFLSQMLVVIVGHWEHGEELSRGLTPLEYRMFEDALALQIMSLQEQADETPDGVE